MSISGSELQVTAAKSYQMYFKDRAFEEAVQSVLGRNIRWKLVAGEAPPAPALSARTAPAEEDDTTNRALANPEVQRFRQVFGGEIRKVRNLKE